MKILALFSESNHLVEFINKNRLLSIIVWIMSIRQKCVYITVTLFLKQRLIKEEKILPFPVPDFWSFIVSGLVSFFVPERRGSCIRNCTETK